MFPKARIVFMCSLMSGIGFAGLGAPVPAATASHTLTVVTTGVCALNKDSSGVWSVFIPQANAPTVTVNSPHHPIPGHRPYLSVQLLNPGENLFPGNVRQPNSVFSRKPPPKVTPQATQWFAVFFLDDEWLSLKGARSQVNPPSGKIPAEIVSMGEVCCIAAKALPTTGGKELTAHVELGSGDLQVGALTEDIMSFAPPREPCPGTTLPAVSGARRLAQEIILKFGFDSGALSFSKIKGQKEAIEFPNLARDVRIEIGNTPVEDILGVGIEQLGKVDTHFELLYNLIPRDAGRLPHAGTPHVPHSQSLILKAGGTNCPPVKWR
jgi:hypothetical protein